MLSFGTTHTVNDLILEIGIPSMKTKGASIPHVSVLFGKNTVRPSYHISLTKEEVTTGFRPLPRQ